MGLSDPFSTTAALAQGSIGGLANPYLEAIRAAREKARKEQELLAQHQRQKELLGEEDRLKLEGLKNTFPALFTPEGTLDIEKAKQIPGLSLDVFGAEYTTPKEKELDINDIIKIDAWEKYKVGDRSPEVMRVIGAYVNPMEVLMGQQLGFGKSDSSNFLPSTTEDTTQPPKYNPKTHKLQRNKKTGKHRIVPR